MISGSRTSRRCACLHRSSNERPGVVPSMVGHLRACAIALVKRASNGGAHPVPKGNGSAHTEDRQERTHHQRAEAHSLQGASPLCRKPALSDLRTLPSHAHHVRYAQSRGLSLKVSDEFTVPLCAIHHHHIHTTGKEREWWQKRNIDPLKVANDLWQQTRQRQSSTTKADALQEDASQGELQRSRETEGVHQASAQLAQQASSKVEAGPGPASDNQPPQCEGTKGWCSILAERWASLADAPILIANLLTVARDREAKDRQRAPSPKNLHTDQPGLL